MTIVHSLNPSYPWDSSLPAAGKAEAGATFIAAGSGNFGALGNEAKTFLGQLFKRYATRSTHDAEVSFPGKLQRECWQRVSVALHKCLGKFGLHMKALKEG